MSKMLQNISIVWAVDTYPDLSYIGEYAVTWKPGAIDREELGDMRHGEFRYFVPAMTGEETGNPDSPMEDYRRMEKFNRGDWWCEGCRAVAEVVIGGVLQKITSGGLWGIESDGGDEYKNEIAVEQYNELVEILLEMGFERRDIERAACGNINLEFEVAS